MASSPYPLGTFPQQMFGGGISRSKYTPYNGTIAVGKVGNQFNGGTIFAGAPNALQNNSVFDNTFGVLTGPTYLGVRNAYNENKPYQQYFNVGAGWGVIKPLSGGNFGTVVKGQYIMIGFTSQIAGVANTVMNSPGQRYGAKSQNMFIGWINSTTYWKNNNGGFYMYNGLPVNPLQSRDSVSNETLNTYASPGKIAYWIGSPLAKLDTYKSRND